MLRSPRSSRATSPDRVRERADDSEDTELLQSLLHRPRLRGSGPRATALERPIAAVHHRVGRARKGPIMCLKHLLAGPALALVMAVAASPTVALASSHSEAPGTTKDR